jgi:hypothetical protein
MEIEGTCQDPDSSQDWAVAMVTNDSHVVLLRDETRARGFGDETRGEVSRALLTYHPACHGLPAASNAISLNDLNKRKRFRIVVEAEDLKLVQAEGSI